MDYRFKDKDPVIDCLRTIIQISAAQAGRSFAAELRQIERDCRGFVKASTMQKWFYGATRSPIFANVARVACTVSGRPMIVGGEVVGKVKGFRIIQGGRSGRRRAA